MHLSSKNNLLSSIILLTLKNDRDTTFATTHKNSKGGYDFWGTGFGLTLQPPDPWGYPRQPERQIVVLTSDSALVPAIIRMFPMHILIFC